MKPNTSSRCVHQVARWATVIASIDMNSRETLATRLPKGDHAPQGSSVAAIRQPSTRKPVTRIAKITTRMIDASVV